MALSESPIKIFILVEYEIKEMAHSLFMIDLPTDLIQQKVDLEDGFEEISPVWTFPENKFLNNTEFVKLGSEIYLFGGRSLGLVPSLDRHTHLQTTVQVLDTNNPEKGLQRVAPMNAIKERNCAFVADGMIYTLGAAVESSECGMSGCFERYSPQLDKWEVLPDPPLSLELLSCADWTSHATVVGRKVFIGSHWHDLYLIFNLDTQRWDKVPPTSVAQYFPYGAICVENSLYHMREKGAVRQCMVFDRGCGYEPLHIVKRGPLPKPITSSSKGILNLKNALLNRDKVQVLATSTELEGNDETFFTHSSFNPWRELLHLGGSFFCYVVAAEVMDNEDGTSLDPHTRFFWIKVFKEVKGESGAAEFLPLASFFYKFRADFPTYSEMIRCCAVGHVPDSWSNLLPKKQQESRKRTVKRTATTTSLQEKQESSGSKDVQTEGHDQAADAVAVCNLKKLLAAQEEEIRRLKDELARLAKNKNMLMV